MTRLVPTLGALCSAVCLVGVARGQTPSPQEVVVRGQAASERARQSPQAVDVLELEADRYKSDDLGQVLAQRSNLKVQREGGLGSVGRYSLNGLSGDRVRFFVDGVPLELSPYQLGVANVPIGLVDRVEIYQGVVPVRFGADALGGAVNLVTDEKLGENRASASYQFGSFGTHRLALSARRFFPAAGVFVRGNAFLDRADNDYPVNVQSFDDSGQLTPVTVKRFHDGYRGRGASIGVGVTGRPYADRILAQVYGADYTRNVQHNPGMTVPYGEVTYGRSALGGQLSYRKRIDNVRFDATIGHAARNSSFRDVSNCRYDWYGRCFLRLPLRGELSSVPSDVHVDDSTWFARAEMQARLAERHALRLALSPTWTRRQGADREIAAERYDALRSARRLTSGVLGLEYEGVLGWLSSSSFVKAYYQGARSQERLPTGVLREPRANDALLGFGDSLRVALTDTLTLKAAYEYAARLPSADERFGDGGLVAESLELAPERSHNYNLGAYVEGVSTPVGSFKAKLAGAARRVSSMIVLLNTGSYYQYSNVLSARALGVDASAGYQTPNQVFGASLNLGYEDVRNTSREGPGALFEGDRIPNLPYFQVGGAAQLRGKDVLTRGDGLELAWNVRYVREFLRGWQSAGQSDDLKLKVPSQTVHGVTLTHSAPGTWARLTSSFEIQNVTDAKVFDFYGVQRPGRSFFWKTSLDYQ